MTTKKLIEVALPLEKINAESAREKSIRHGHPSTLHLWWARRPLAAARAVIWSSLVDDPSSHPEQFPTEEDQNRERQRLFKILEDLVVWENSNNEDVLSKATKEIANTIGYENIEFLDPFAGGGALPLEAARLGLHAHAHDLNPVALTINKAMIEIPEQFSDIVPVNPNNSLAENVFRSSATSVIAEDVNYYGDLLKKKVFQRIGHLYPKVKSDGQELTVMAWIWARVVKCPNPACGKEIPLANTFDICKKKGHESYVIPYTTKQGECHFILKHGINKGLHTTKNGRGGVFTCPFCGSSTSDGYVKDRFNSGEWEKRLMAIVAEGTRSRVYIEANDEQIAQTTVNADPDFKPDEKICTNPRWFSPPAFGLDTFSSLFTERQLVMFDALCSALDEVTEQVHLDAITAGMSEGLPLANNGSGARAYSEAVRVYLSFVIDKLVDYHSSICVWHTTGEKLANTMRRQAIQMTWDYAEGNPFCSSSGSIDNMLGWIVSCLKQLPVVRQGVVKQQDAQSDCGLRNVVISTDPPYYDNIGYADLSDYFYVWLRHNLRNVYPALFSTLLVPKAEELIATPFRFEGSSEKAKDYFENGMLECCTLLHQYARDDIPVTIYYAFKAGDADTKSGASGWETMLTAIIKAGFAITGTWPMRTEMSTRSVAQGTNALASSIVLVCRKRSEDAPKAVRRVFVNTLRRELREALQKLQQSNIAPVDLAQSAIGPGMGVFSRYSRVLEADGTPMTVRSALQVINEEIDLYFNEQVGDLDAMSRFCVDLYTQNAFNDIKFGDADILARAKGTSVAALSSHDVVYAKAGNVHLIERTELGEKKIDTNESCIWMLTQQLTQAMAAGGVDACAKAIFIMFGSNAERAKDLAYRLYTIAEQKNWASEAFAYNALVVAWPDIQTAAARMQRETPEQLDMFSMGLLNT